MGYSLPAKGTGFVNEGWDSDNFDGSDHNDHGDHGDYDDCMHLYAFVDINKRIQMDIVSKSNF